jgi:hypothetical protein
MVEVLKGRRFVKEDSMVKKVQILCQQVERPSTSLRGGVSIFQIFSQPVSLSL